MIDATIRFSIRHRALVIAASLALAVLGVWACWLTPVDAIPDLSENQVIVFTDWKGHGPREVEDQLTYPLALGLQGIRGVRVVRSSSDVGFSMISVIFEDAVDFEEARRRVAERLARTRAELPAGACRSSRPTRWPPGRSTGTRSRGAASTWVGFARSRTGTSARSSRRSPAWPRWRASAAIRSNTRSLSTREDCRHWNLA